MSAWRLGRIAGIDISVHWSFLLLVVWVAVSSPAGGAVANVVLLLAVFGCVLLHELGHALAARQFSIGTRGITLLPIGGVASLERMPRRPAQELWIALAGPLVNVGIAAALFLVSLPLQLISASSLLPAVNQLMFVNVGLVLFNMLPAFPMDGGRVLRSILALFLPYMEATNVAATVGKVMAGLLAVTGLLASNILLVFIAAFIFLAGSAEAKTIQAEHEDNQAIRESPSWGFRSAHVDRPVVVWDENERKYRVLSASQSTW